MTFIYPKISSFHTFQCQLIFTQQRLWILEKNSRFSIQIVFFALSHYHLNSFDCYTEVWKLYQLNHEKQHSLTSDKRNHCNSGEDLTGSKWDRRGQESNSWESGKESHGIKTSERRQMARMDHSRLCEYAHLLSKSIGTVRHEQF